MDLEIERDGLEERERERLEERGEMRTLREKAKSFLNHQLVYNPTFPPSRISSLLSSLPFSLYFLCPSFIFLLNSCQENTIRL